MAIKDGVHGRSRGHDDVATSHGLVGSLHGAYVDGKLFRHLLGELPPVLRGRTVDSDFVDIARQKNRFQMRAGLPAGAEQPEDVGILSRQIFDADAAGGPDPASGSVVSILNR
ncbi:MAG: hypothetical protein HW373_1499 [Deltaproteobacteria bacterium]|nr:hypothetical protein [Deltaproteobacteria bacterium]